MTDTDRQDSLLNGNELLAGLADCSLPAAAFTHRAHVCAAWHCLQAEPLDAATARFVRLLKAYVAHLGAQDKYHHTLTLALLRLIHARMTPADDWPAFAAANRDLLDNARGLLTLHYSDERLHSAAARTRFLEADRLPLPV